MSELRQVIDQYLALRRSLGYTLRGVASGLRSFAGFAAREGATRVTIDLALRWAGQSRGTALATQGSRLQMVRRFAQWRHVTDPRTEVPPHDLLPTRFPRKPPYLYRDTELDQLLKVTRTLPSSTGLRGRTYFTLFGLLMVTGMRVGEAVALDEDDVNLEEEVLSIRRTKLGKSRLVPVHPSTVAVLADYAKARDRLHPRRVSTAFFVTERGVRVSQWMVGYTFVRVSGQIGLRPPMHGHSYGHGPRLHDLRHRFAARTILDWYRAGIDVERAMPRLATLLGPCARQRDVLVSGGRTRTPGTGHEETARRTAGGDAMSAPNLFSRLLQSFFTDRLLRQRSASAHTIASYRDAFRLLLRFAQQRLGKHPTALALDDLDARFLGEFLDHVERERGNSARTRNVRLAAIHAFFRYVSICEPAHADRCHRILAIPAKRHLQRPIAFLDRDEIDALLAAPDGKSWIARRQLLLPVVLPHFRMLLDCLIWFVPAAR